MVTLGKYQGRSHMKNEFRRSYEHRLKQNCWYRMIVITVIAVIFNVQNIKGWISTSYRSYRKYHSRSLCARGRNKVHEVTFCMMKDVGHELRFSFHVSKWSTSRLFQSSTNEGSGVSSSSSSVTTKQDEEEVTVEEELSDVDTRVLRAMLQEEKFDLNDENELRKLLERGTVKKVKSANKGEQIDDDDSMYSSKVLKTLTDTKLWKKLSKQTSDLLESARILVVNKIEQDLKVVTALGFFTFDRIQQDIARALPATSSSNNIPKQILLLTNRSAYDELKASSDKIGSSSSARSIRDEMSRPEDEIKSVSRELFAILSGERNNYYNSRIRSSSNSQGTLQQQPSTSQRGLRTVAPAGTAYSAERQRRALQQKRKMEQSKKQNILNPTNVVVDSVWELRQEMKSEMNVPGYRTEPIRNAIAASVSATNNLLQGVRQQAQLVAAATIRNKEQQQAQETLMLEQQRAKEVSADIESQQKANEFSTIEANTVINPTAPLSKEHEPPMSALEQGLFKDICAERLRIMDQITTCIDNPTESWLTTDVVDTFDNLEFISSPGMENTIAKMILLRDEIEKNHIKISENDNAANSDVSAALLDSAIKDLIAIRTAVEYLYNCTVEDVSDLVAEEIRYFVLFSSSSSTSTLSTMTYENVPLILRIEDEVNLLEQKQEEIDDDEVASVGRILVEVEENISNKKRKSGSVKSSSKVIVPEISDAIADAVLVDVDISASSSSSSSVADDSIDVDEVLSGGTGYVAELVTDDYFFDGFDGEVITDRSSTFKQVYNIDDDDDDNGSNNEPNILLVVVLRSIDVVLFITEKVLTVGVPGTMTIVSNIVTRIDESNQLGLGTKGWKELRNVENGKGRY